MSKNLVSKLKYKLKVDKLKQGHSRWVLQSGHEH